MTRSEARERYEVANMAELAALYSLVDVIQEHRAELPEWLRPALNRVTESRLAVLDAMRDVWNTDPEQDTLNAMSQCLEGRE